MKAVERPWRGFAVEHHLTAGRALFEYTDSILVLKQ